MTDLTGKILVKIQDQLASLQATVTALQTQTAALQTQTAALQTQTAALQTQIDSLPTRDEVTARFDRVDRRIDNANMHLVAMDARLSTEISGLRGMLHELEPAQSTLEDRVEKCERDIEELRRRD